MDSKMPIIRFANLEEAKLCMQEWQRRLYLDDWIIKLNFANHEDFEATLGSNTANAEMKSCVITLIDVPKRLSDNHIITYCQEATLVHELLHCYDYVRPVAEGTYEQMMFNATKHQMLEMMARSLVEAKYGLERSFWVNQSAC